jgi:NADPH-dependent curcumin reductase CurA
MIETYNDENPAGLKNMMRIVRARIRLQGFIIFDYSHRISEFHEAMGGWMAEGRIRSDETVRQGLEQTPAAFLGLFSGGNSGKMLVQL